MEDKERLFAQKLNEVMKLAKEQNNCISEDQVKEAFLELSLSENQLQMVYDYLIKHKIGVNEPVDMDDYLSDEEIDYLKLYEEDLSHMESLSNGQKEAVILSAMAGETDAQKKLIELYLPQVIEISKIYSGQGVFLEDLIGEGNLALTMGVTMLGCLENAKEAEGMLIKMVMDAMEELISENLEAENITKKAIDQAKADAKKAKEKEEGNGNTGYRNKV